MKLIYFRGHQQNFGDDLNAELWPKLRPELFAEPSPSGFLGIGTIIGMKIPACTPLHVFSSGAGYDDLQNWQPDRRVWCVRGPLTARLLDCTPDIALTDGAILAPDVLCKGQAGPAEHIGVVPHWESLHFPGWQQACDYAGHRLISPIDTPVNVMAKLSASRLVLTESLHGAILADALGVPWIPFISTRNVSRFKWIDWCLSVGVEFAPATISPPSVQAALRFGRPEHTLGKSRQTYNAEAGIAEYRMRVGQTPLSPPKWSRRLLVAGLTQAASRTGLVGRALGFHPERTAEALSNLAQLPPTLSQASLRSSLRNRMMDRLDDLARFHAHTKASAHA